MISKVEPTYRIDEKPAAYRSLSMVDLIVRIAENSDEKAICEFHSNRKVFFYDNDDSLLFVELLERLRDEALIKHNSWPASYDVVDRAYNLMIDKFTHIPKEIDSSYFFPKRVQANGSDCRFYFRAALNRLDKMLKRTNVFGELQKELLAYKTLQNFVVYHFHLSILEAKRKTNPLWSRYNWKLNGTNICVWMPVTLSGQQRRKWLEDHIENPDPSRLEERQRIQALIKKAFPHIALTSLNNNICKQHMSTNRDPNKSDPEFIKSLGAIISQEKAENIHKQRRSIQGLGVTNLKKLILYIFKNIGCSEYKDHLVAKRFGLTPPTFSRFAGSRWSDTGEIIPDLWKNTAQVLSLHPAFREIAVKTRVWKRVQTTLMRTQKS
jgi:hypothetical protein